LLGYEIDLDNKLFKKHLEFLRNTRYKRAEKMHNRLKELGLVFPFEHILEKAGKAPVARPHIASALVDMGFVANFREGFDIYLNDRGPAYEPKWVFPVENGIKLINQIGGIAVLAHPGKYVAQEALFRFINAGLDGIEVIHPSHDEKKQRHYSSIASQYLILETGGSDYNGLKDHEEELFGKITVPYSFVESIRSYLA
ncbi:MAG: PHP domain-containing protein, partial [Bacteroidota bacterium]